MQRANSIAKKRRTENEIIPLESEEEENVGSEIEAAEVAAELKGLTARKQPELELPRATVAAWRSFASVLAAEADDGIWGIDGRKNNEG